MKIFYLKLKYYSFKYFTSPIGKAWFAVLYLSLMFYMRNFPPKNLKEKTHIRIKGISSDLNLCSSDIKINNKYIFREKEDLYHFNEEIYNKIDCKLKNEKKD